jgi:two-component system, chemotaxis family, CheB/CheR fusion protein
MTGDQKKRRASGKKRPAPLSPYDAISEDELAREREAGVQGVEHKAHHHDNPHEALETARRSVERAAAAERELDAGDAEGEVASAGQAVDAAPQQDDDADRPHVICIGASAGGLEPLQTFFAHVKDMPCCAYVVITHLEASKPSMLPELIQRHASLPVDQIADGLRLEKDHVYIIPPDREVTLEDQHFRLSSRKKDGYAQPINAFMCSLAKVEKHRSIGVILSGMGSDGSLGIRAIKQEFGMVVAQDPETTQFASMPRSAIDTGLVDAVLMPKEMPQYIASFIKQQGKMSPYGSRPLDRQTAQSLGDIVYLLRKHSGHDFSNYKTGTLLRRIQRRMGIHQLEDMASYIRYLHEHPKEIGVLFKEMLIGVTNFFRDPEAWTVIESKVLPQLLDDKPDDYTVRIWVPGAATGEEAYTIAIVFQDYIERHHLNLKVQIFATDINEDAVEAARVGLYPPSIAEDMSEERLRRFFTKENGYYRAGRQIREMIVFAAQNLIKDPPFTKLDYICCRNLLIYLDSDLQRKVLPLFHYTLRQGGVLFLGSSESIGEFAELFETLDSRWKIYRRRETGQARAVVDFALRHGEIPQPRDVKHAQPSLARVAERGLLEAFAPPCVVAKKDGEIVYIHGRTGQYLEPAPGQARLNVIEMAREGLRNRLPSLIQSAMGTRGKVATDGVKVRTNGSEILVKVIVEPVRDETVHDDLVLISFHDDSGSRPRKSKGGKGRSGYVDELERELADTRENLQTTIEELETSNEEMRSVNEEYQSTNEELQSANEELETSREEMQSLNEELGTVNEELQDKVDTLTLMAQDMQVFLDSLDNPTIFLDHELQIKRFTSQARRVLNIMDQDLNRPLAHLATHLKDVNLLEAIQQVNESLEPLERVVETHDGHPYLMRVLPYRKVDHTIEGIVLNFVDVQKVRGAVQHGDNLLPRDLAETVMNTIREPIIVLDEELTVILANAAFYATFDTTERATVGHRLDELSRGDWKIKELRQRLEQTLAQETRLENLEVKHAFRGLGPRRLILNSRTIRDGGAETRNIVLSIRDVSRP